MKERLSIKIQRPSEIEAQLGKKSKISIAIDEDRSLSIQLDRQPKISAKLDSVIIGSKPPDQYEGAYQIVPKPDVITVLETEQKLLTDNITVLEIPYFDVSNEYGNTVYIGNEVEINGN